MTETNVPFIDVGAFDRVEDSGEASRFVEWMTHQRRGGSDPTLHLLKLSDEDVVIDIGCGPGTDLATMAKSARIAVGIDRSRSMAKSACEAVSMYPSADVLISDGQDLPFRDASFTAANCRAVLIHTPRPEDAIAEIARVLAPGGQVLLCEPDHGSHIVATSEQALFLRVLAHRRTTFRNPLIGRHLPALISRVGLVVVEVMSLPIIHRSFASARASGGPFDVAVRNAVDAGALTVQEGVRYLDSLEELDRDGAFFFSAVAIAALARKPSH